VAIKQLIPFAPAHLFEQEYTAYRRIADRHPNISRVIHTFYHSPPDARTINFVMPLAECSLQQLFGGECAADPVGKMTQLLWSQLHGLASAYQFLHETCGLLHGDAAPKNTLIFLNEMGDDITVKLTDFGLIKLLQPSNSPFGHEGNVQAPPVRMQRSCQRAQAMPWQLTPTELLEVEIFKVGSLLLEIVMFLLLGRDGLLSFRSTISPLIQGGRSNNRTDDTFLDDEMYIAEMLRWLQLLAQLDNRASEMRPIFVRIFCGSDARPSAREVAEFLSKVCSLSV
jgi:serine/threonine protein kinase